MHLTELDVDDPWKQVTVDGNSLQFFCNSTTVLKISFFCVFFFLNKPSTDLEILHKVHIFVTSWVKKMLTT